MPTFPTPNISRGLHEPFVYANTVTNNIFGPMILLSIFLIILIGFKMKGFRTEDSFASAIFSTTSVGYVMMIIPNLISVQIVIGMTMMTALTAFFLYMSR